MDTEESADGRGTEAERERARLFRKMGYPASGLRFSPFAPAIWVAVVWVAMVGMLYAVGYLDADVDRTGKLAELVARLKQPDVDFAARRAARAFSGVTLAITLVLSFTSFVWAWAAFLRKSNHFRWPALGLMVLFLIALLAVSRWVSETYQPFTSEFGQLLLNPESSGAPSKLAAGVPTVMFILACVVPCILLAGATFLLQPMVLPGEVIAAPDTASVFRGDQLKILMGRVQELDQMLYIGALALVFGTLQLSAGLSVPLVSMPKAPSVRTQAELCKLISPSAASSPFYAKASASSPDGAAVDKACYELPKQLAQLEWADSLRQLVRGITLCFGLAFSALLSAVYVPALVGLRLMIDERLPGGSATDSAETNKAIAEIDPLHRVAAVVATLSPLLAGLLANTLAVG